jgi:hypothetical protein
MEKEDMPRGDPKAEASARSGQALKKANHPLQGLKGVLEKFLLLPLRERRAFCTV